MDIQHLIEEATQTMLSQEHVMPMLHLELTEQYLIFALDILSDSQSIPQQCGILARLAWEHCQKYPGQHPKACAFYGEAWRVTGQTDADTRMYPSHSPKRQEIISVQTWQADRNPPYQTYHLPVIRDHKKRVVDVGPVNGPLPLKSFQIEAIVQGAHDAQHPDEAFSRMEKQIVRSLGHLSEKTKQDLKSMMREQGMGSIMHKFGLDD